MYMKLGVFLGHSSLRAWVNFQWQSASPLYSTQSSSETVLHGAVRSSTWSLNGAGQTYGSTFWHDSTANGAITIITALKLVNLYKALSCRRTCALPLSICLGHFSFSAPPLLFKDFPECVYISVLQEKKCSRFFHLLLVSSIGYRLCQGQRNETEQRIYRRAKDLIFNGLEQRDILFSYTYLLECSC